jgi:hypothetical protein
MNNIFISYRRKESADFVGRLFDRLSGYFGPDSIAMDVDTLISGMDYREEIGKIIGNCQVFLAVIGPQWISLKDETGQRRLDNPDDQLRIEVATALQRGTTVIPILIHGARMPSPEELPADIRALAEAEPIEIQSGLPFNTDVRKFLDRLEQKHGLRHPDRRFPLQLVLIPLGIVLTVVGTCMTLNIPFIQSYVAARIPNHPGEPGTDVSLAGYESDLVNMVLFCTIPLGLGPLLIVLGSRWCCVNKERRREQLHFSAGIGTRPTPKSGLSVLCLAFGLAALGLGLVAAVPAFLFGAWALIDIRQRTGWVRGRSLVVVGLLAALAGGIGTTYLHVNYWRFHAWLSAVERAEVAVAEGDTVTALSAYQEAADSHPGNRQCTGVCCLARAEIFLRSADHAKAIDELTAFITRIEPWSPSPTDSQFNSVMADAYRKRGMAYQELGEAEKAEADLKRAEEVRFSKRAPLDDGRPDLYEEAPPPAPEMPPASEIPPPPIIDPSA